jgi:hypothetical protein
MWPIMKKHYFSVITTVMGACIFAGNASACEGRPPVEINKELNGNLDLILAEYQIHDLVCWEFRGDKVATRVIDHAIRIGKVEAVGPQDQGRNLKVVVKIDETEPLPTYDLQRDHDLFMSMLFKSKSDRLYQPHYGDVYRDQVILKSNIYTYLDQSAGAYISPIVKGLKQSPWDFAVPLLYGAKFAA